MITLVMLLALGPADPTYTELSKKQGLQAADALMRDGKFLEAAVTYRNILLTPGEREAVRIPLALALLAKGDAVYGGIEIRRAHMLYPDFVRLALDPAELLGSKGILTKAADSAIQHVAEGEGAEVDAIAAYAYFREGERERAQAALARYVQSRGNDAFARDLTAALTKVPAAPVAAKVEAPAPPTPSGPVPKVEPVKAGMRYREPEARPLGEILSK
jgi:thioredoxin-like negative regulator of GroEL